MHSFRVDSEVVSGPRVCLSMIVKDEAHVIARCLESVLGVIDSWLIVDTGSTDGTQEVIREFMAAAHKPGQLAVRPWRDFGSNRSEALELARPLGDYCLFIDADEVWSAPPDFRLPELSADAYRVLHRHKATDTRFWLTQIVASRLPFRFQGVLHEAITCDLPHVVQDLPGPTITGWFDSARNRLDPVEKYNRDARVLEAALEREPDNARYVFYLAQSYRDATQLEPARATYERRSKMGGWEEEAWYAALWAARLAENLGRPEAAILGLLAAYERRPTRAESLCDLARLHRTRREFQLAYLFAKKATTLPMPPDVLFVEEGVYRWRAWDELAVAAYWVGQYAECQSIGERLLGTGVVPEPDRPRIRKNCQLAERKIREMGTSSQKTPTP